MENCLPFFTIYSCDIRELNLSVIGSSIFLIIFSYILVSSIGVSLSPKSVSQLLTIRFWLLITCLSLCVFMVSLLPKQVSLNLHTSFLNYLGKNLQTFLYLYMAKQIVSISLIMRSFFSKLLVFIIHILFYLCIFSVFSLQVFIVFFANMNYAKYTYTCAYFVNMFDQLAKILFIATSTNVFVQTRKLSQFFDERVLSKMKILLFLISFFVFVSITYYQLVNLDDPIYLYYMMNFGSWRKQYILLTFWIEFLIENIPVIMLSGIMYSISKSKGNNDVCSVTLSTLIEDDSDLKFDEMIQQ